MIRNCVLILALSAVFAPSFLAAQIGGRHVYDFLNLTPQARIAGIGGVNVSTADWDQNTAYQNPATLNDSMHNRVSLSYVNYLAGINYGYASYAYSLENIADFHAGVQYVGYGNMTGADQFGNLTSDFTASDVALVMGASKKVYNYRIGANLKVINSSIAGYNSFTALAFDLGGTYVSDDHLFTAGMVFRNIGAQISKYSPTGEREPLPFEIQAGVSYKLKHMPLRMSLTAINLEHPRMIYKEENPEPIIDLSGDTLQPKKNTVDDIFRHFVFGGEFLISPNLNLRFGYNHMRRRELRSANRSGIAGFSFGVGLKIAEFNLDYAFGSYHAIGGSHSISVATNIGRFKKK